ncbi:hypothetical protein ACFYM2_21325 [Streptomyces sp. NPDC006711]|uniref:hypothetical protein n=1 Tax=Streptomyces sp. NPDC006711 TaxID=3364762 RepID=UPI0036A1DDE8
MPWVRLDDRFPSHRKVALLSDRAFRLYISALCWSSENLTEGKILDRELSVVSRVRGLKASARELEEAQLWDRVDGGWQIHDFLEYNPDRAKIKADRQANAARQQAFRDRKKAEREAKKAASQGPARNASRNGVTSAVENQENDTTATASRHDDDTKTRESRAQNQRSSQFSAFRNGVSNGAPAPAPSPTSTSYGSTGAASSDRAGGLPDQLAPLKRAIATAGLSGIAWDLRESGWEYTRQAMDRVGIPAMVAYAVNSARLKGQPAGASAWVQGWRSLEAPEQQDGVAYLPAAVGSGIAPANRQQQETNDLFDRAMARAKSRMQEEK